MNKLVLSILIVTISSAVAYRPAPSSDLNRTLSPELSNYVNSVQNSWVAGEIPEMFKGLTLAQIKARFFGTVTPLPLEDLNHVSLVNNRSNDDIPTNFNSAEQWPGCVHPVRDQGHCDSGWAHSTSEVLSDRLCIASNGSINVVLSPQYLISCDKDNLGCSGGYPGLAWYFIMMAGLPTESCYPYSSSNGTTGTCKGQTCQDGSEWKTYKSKAPITLINPLAIQKDILAYGPVTGTFTVYEDFLAYKSGIYKHVSGAYVNTLSVKIVGWGRDESGTNYWIVYNSWGATWGEAGTFKIAFGQCGIDRAATSAQANLSGAFRPKIAARWA